MSQLARVVGFANKAQTLVVSAATHRLTNKPDISLPEDADHHADDHAMALPNMPKQMSTPSMSKLLIANHLTASNSFTSKIFLNETSLFNTFLTISLD